MRRYMPLHTRLLVNILLSRLFVVLVLIGPLGFQKGQVDHDRGDVIAIAATRPDTRKPTSHLRR